MPITLRNHWDPDGLCTSFFTSFGVPDSIVSTADYDKGFGYTGGLSKDDWILDMKPDNPKWDGNCIDHHLPHDENHKYNLISDDVPATLIAWRHFKDKIPKNEWWKVSIGLCGDGQPELIPTEIYKECPSLLKGVKTSAYQSYGKWNINIFPLYKLLSSGLNALMRKEEYDAAYNLLRYADTPMALYSSEDTRIAKLDIKNDFKTAVMDCDMVDYGNLVVVIYYSKYRMSGYIASSLQDSLKGKTVMAINKRNGSISVRGDLAYYYRDILEPLEYLTIGGHAGFCGGKLTKNYNKLISDMDELL